MADMNDIPDLTDRERLIAEAAANLAVERMTTQFYANIGKQFVNKIFILIGASVVAFAVGKGWVKLP